AGASQATVSHAYSDSGIFRGIAVADHNGMDTEGVAKYDAGNAMNAMRRGRAFVPVIGAVAFGDALYLILTGDNKGKFTASSGSTLATGVKACEAASDGTICKVEINLP